MRNVGFESCGLKVHREGDNRVVATADAIPVRVSDACVTQETAAVVAPTVAL